MSETPTGGYLFDPIRVQHLLVSLPNLRSKLANLLAEDRPSQAFPKARRTTREIYRVLGNDHYANLATLLRRLDRCVGAGFEQPNLIRTRSRKPFAEGLSEVHVADHLLNVGFEVRGFDADKGNASVPDILAHRRDLQLAVEVYTPRRWEGVDRYVDAFGNTLRNLDVPYDFRCTVEHDVMDRVRNGQLFSFHPGALSQQLENINVDLHVGQVIAILAPQFRNRRATADIRLDAVNLVTSVVCDSTATVGDYPSRRVIVRGPPLAGHAPESDFVDIVRRSVRKLGEGQATTIPGAVPCLIVDLSLCNLESELAHPVYQQMFGETLRSNLADLRGHGLVAFVRHPAMSDPPEVLFVRVAAGVPREVGELWGTPLISS